MWLKNTSAAIKPIGHDAHGMRFIFFFDAHRVVIWMV